MSTNNSIFIDEFTLDVSSGHGGAGAVSFRREKYVERGGPDGGDGGKGGDVIFRVSDRLRTLTHLKGKYSLKAKAGSPGMGKRRFGLNGDDLIIEVPPGTTLRNSETNELLFDFFSSPDTAEYTCLKGGKGGRGNWHFKTSRVQVPRFAQEGEDAESISVRIEMSLIADVGLVGFPNAGKSTLLNHVTNAHSKTGAYPFTTKIPYLGVLRLYDHDIVIADIPGLIEGAHQGKGLGHQFLKHISRTKIIAFIVDFSESDYEEQLKTLQNELLQYDKVLIDKKMCLIATKMDLKESQRHWQEWQSHNHAFPCLAISAFNREGLEELPQWLDSVLNH